MHRVCVKLGRLVYCSPVQMKYEQPHHVNVYIMCTCVPAYVCSPTLMTCESHQYTSMCVCTSYMYICVLVAAVKNEASVGLRVVASGIFQSQFETKKGELVGNIIFFIIQYVRITADAGFPTVTTKIRT